MSPLTSQHGNGAARTELLAARLHAAPDDVRWASSEELRAARARRRALLDELAESASFLCRGSKPVVGALSPGCGRCAEGTWSCLFITGRCNAQCFFCPAPQDKVGEPQTAGLSFTRPEDYADYLSRCGFRGSSLSGGEPLLDAERSLRFLRVIRRRLGAELHLWLYSNGTRLTPELATRLRDAGLDEIRFNLAAVGYRLDALRIACGVIPTVTVEVPAIPGDEEKLAALLPQLAQTGVRHLNLHQLRATPHNLPQLKARHLALAPGPEVVVLGSEETALALLAAGRTTAPELGIHYCSYLYRHHYQRLAARRRAAGQFMDEHEALTATGHIRRLSLLAAPAELASRVLALEAAGFPSSRWQLDATAGQLHLHPTLWRQAGGPTSPWAVQYELANIAPAMSYHRRYRELPLNRRRSLVVERSVVLRQRPLSHVECELMDAVIRGDEGAAAELSPAAAGLAALELLPVGLDAPFLEEDEG